MQNHFTSKYAILTSNIKAQYFQQRVKDKSSKEYISLELVDYC